ncbi:piggyBac transposable element-derived protein 1-like [Homalodisca vitripennis]|uniref:piggyBac transposable element-derived protein 1-like n=1 Tax=Homalodisca vitripennis TaxID=197043 RepID=UPI001EEA5595|nr:piggyBac transposable element-derived protein 1-like [Homalodisca vitripennis]
MDEFLNTVDILDALLPLSDCSEDLDDVDADPDFEVSSDEDDRRTPRKIQQPVYAKLDPSQVTDSSSDEDENIPPPSPQPGEPDLGSCAKVVVRLSRCISPQNHQLYMDNFYTTVPLVVHLAKRNVHALGTVRRDRVPGNNLPSPSEFQAKERGFSTEKCAKVEEVELSLVAWQDNKCVTLLSSFVGIGKQDKVGRYCKKTRSIKEINCPQVVNTYNQHMGGVDKINSILGRYKIRMKTRKWYMRLFYHLLDVTMCNSWLLYQRVCKEKGKVTLPLAEFRESVALTMCKLGAKQPLKRGRPSTELDVALQSKAKKPHVSAIPPKDMTRHHATGSADIDCPSSLSQ